jgi:Uma2 family endonuclease
MPESAIKWTYEEFVKIPDDGSRHEIIEGEHFVTASPVTRHQKIVMRLTLALGNHLATADAGEVFGAPLDVVLTHHPVVEPDLIYVSRERAGIITEKNIQGAPDLLVEVLSPGTRSREENLKRRVYLESGVREYWIVDPDANEVAVWRDDECMVVSISGTLTTPLLPGMEISPPEIFA